MNLRTSLLALLLISALIGVGWRVSVLLQPSGLVLYEEPPEGAKRVLWLGNSHTFRHDVPRRVQQRIEELGHAPVFVKVFAAPGLTLDDHLENEEVIEAFKQDWDLVVAQEGSWASARSLWWSRADLRKIERLSKSPVLLPQAWSYSHFEGRRDTGPLDTPDSVQRHLDRATCAVHALDEVSITPVGHAIHAARSRGESVVSGDGNHLLEAGANLFAEYVAGELIGAPVDGMDGNTFCAEVPAHTRWTGVVPSLRATGWSDHWNMPAIIETREGVITVRKSTTESRLDAFDEEIEAIGRPVLARLDALTQTPETETIGGIEIRRHVMGDLMAISFPDDVWYLPHLPVRGEHACLDAKGLSPMIAFLEGDVKDARLGVTRGFQVGKDMAWHLKALNGMQDHLEKGLSVEAYRTWAAASLEPPPKRLMDGCWPIR